MTAAHAVTTGQPAPGGLLGYSVDWSCSCGEKFVALGKTEEAARKRACAQQQRHRRPSLSGMDRIRGIR